jgi:chromosomal replication initiation ATPase DnaA
MNTYEQAVHLCGHEAVETVLKQIISNAKIPDLDLFKNWIEQQSITKKDTLKDYDYRRIHDRYMTIDDIRSKSRQCDIVLVRHIMRWYYSRSTDLTLVQIGVKAGLSCHHTSVMNSIHSVDDLIFTRHKKCMEMLNSLKLYCIENEIDTYFFPEFCRV